MSDARKPNGQFGPGNNANPGGRPKLAAELRAKALKAVEDHVIAAWIYEVQTLGDNWVKCSELLAAYGLGKPVQPLTGGVDGDQPFGISVNFVKPDEPKG